MKKTNKEQALAAINAAKKATVGKTFAMEEIRRISAENGFAGNNNFWQCFKVLLNKEGKRAHYTWRETQYPFNMYQLNTVLNHVKKYYRKDKVEEPSEEEKAIVLLKKLGYRVFKIVTYEEEV